MPFDAFVTTLDGLDESVQENYKEVDGGYAFQLNPVTHTMEVDGKDKNFLYAAQEINGLTSSLSKERVANKTNNTTIKAFEKKYGDVDLDELNGYQEKFNTSNDALSKLQDKYDVLAALDPEAEADKLAKTKSDARVKKLQGEWQTMHDEEVLKHGEAVTALTDKSTVLENQLHKVLVSGEATEALIKGGVGENLELLLPQILSQIKSEVTESGYETFVMDSEGNPRIKLDGTNMGVADVVTELQAQWPSQFKIAAKPGGGKPAGGQGGAPQEKPKDAVSKIAAGIAAMQNK